MVDAGTVLLNIFPSNFQAFLAFDELIFEKAQDKTTQNKHLSMQKESGWENGLLSLYFVSLSLSPTC